MLRAVSLPVLLYIVGLTGGIFPLLLNKDGASLIIVGFGAGTLLIYNKLTEGNIDVTRTLGLKVLIVITTLIAILSISYNTYKFSTNYNRVFFVGFIILKLWEAFLVFSTIKQMKKK